MNKTLFIFSSVFFVLFATAARVVAVEAGDKGAPIVFMSDFGTLDDGVAIVKGVILSLYPKAQVIDLTHQVPAFSVHDAGRFIFNTAPHFPTGTVFLTLVDGNSGRNFGGSRKPIVLK